MTLTSRWTTCENATFKAAHGYSNTITHDGADALMFRLGFNWDIDGDSTLYGVRRFSGGNPNVWYSNMFSNDGVTAIQTNARNLEILIYQCVTVILALLRCRPRFCCAL